MEGASLPFQVIPRELRFFDLFDEASENVLAGARELAALVDDLPNAGLRAVRIRELEHEGDELTHRILALLNTTFVVPMDRHDIHHLASSLDDILDAQEAVADLLALHRVKDPLPRFRQQIHVLLRAVEAVRVALRGLRTFDHVETAIASIKREEHEGDWLYRRCLAQLYSGDYRAMDVLKWQDILHQTEAAIDRCEDIANTIEAVVLKGA